MVGRRLSCEECSSNRALRIGGRANSLDTFGAKQEHGAMTISEDYGSAASGWEETRNLSRMPEGNFRSILGYAGESLVIGRALACGYNLFFKAWRDSKYDAVLDSRGVLFRIEIKQSGKGSSLSTTSGGRSGGQISRSAASRETVLSPEDSDFLIGVHSLSGKCWIVPTEVVHCLGRSALQTNQLSIYEEKWSCFASPPRGFTLEELRLGFSKKSLAELEGITRRLGISGRPTLDYQFSPSGRAVKLSSKKHWYILEIWRTIFSGLS
jgi:hypothetical protein